MATNDADTGNFYYRTPIVYRPVEWLTLNTDNSSKLSPLLFWSQLWGARDTVEMQTWFFAQHIDDPTEMHVTWVSPD